MTAERFTVHYFVTPDDARPIERHAKDICIEQTVEIPEDCVTQSHWDEGFVGQVENITPRKDAGFDVAISYRVDITNNTIPNLLNVLFGNISIRRGIKIVGIDFKPSQLAAFGGPRFGIAGIRKVLNAYHRPLATTAIKPMGLPSSELALKCAGYAAGGLDLIKDDHGLIDQSFHPFEDRVPRIMEAITAANAKHGTKTLYCPMVAGTYDQLDRHMAFAKLQGCFGVLVAPMLVGPDNGFHLARKHGLAVMAHPSFTGTHFHDPRHGMTPAVLLGSLFRLFGADISVFPNAGGRFTFTQKECDDLASALRAPWGDVKSSFPAPAGGMTIASVARMLDVYGNDTTLLVGGALLRDDPQRSATAFVEAMHLAVAAKGK